MWYHATLFSRMSSIAEDGLLPREGQAALFAHGGYGAHGEGKLFLAKGLEAALEWLCRVQDMGEASSDHLEDHVAVLLRVRPCEKPVVDPIGNQDISGSYYTMQPILACRIEFWRPARPGHWRPEAGWRPVEAAWDDDAVMLGVKETEFEEDDEYQDNPIHYTFACWEAGGFKPPRSLDATDRMC